MASLHEDDITENTTTEDSDDDLFRYYQQKTLVTLQNPNPDIKPLCDGWCRLNEADTEHIRTLVDRQSEIGDANNVLNIHLGLLRHYLNIHFPIDQYCRCNDSSGERLPPVNLTEWNIPTINSEGKIQIQPHVLEYLEDALSKFYDWEYCPAKPFDADAIMGRHDDDVIDIDNDDDVTNIDDDGDIMMDDGDAAELPEVMSLLEKDVEVNHANTKPTTTKKKVRFADTVGGPVLGSPTQSQAHRDVARAKSAPTKRIAALRASGKKRRSKNSGPTSNPDRIDVNLDDWLVDWSNPSAEIWE